MTKVLLVSGFGVSSTYPNPICVNRIIERLRKCGDITVDVACDGVVENTPVKNWKYHPVYMARRIIRWPSYNPDVEKACRKELYEILSHTHYDCLFVPHKPFETVYSVCKLKKKFPYIAIYIYALDPIANAIDANNGIGKSLFFLTKRAEQRVFQTVDHVFHMECNREKYSGSAYSKYADKFTFLDFPLIEQDSSETEPVYNTGAPVLIYSGALDDTYRPPDYLLEVYDRLSESLDTRLHFYAKGNSVKKIEERAEFNGSIKSFGYVPKQELEEKIEKADFLVNLGNRYSSMLPSKLLTYISTGKPIIHFKNQKDDSCISYLERYGLFVVLDEADPIEISVKKLSNFIVSTRNKRVSKEHILIAFKHNTPAWNTSQIVKVLNGEMP